MEVGSGAGRIPVSRWRRVAGELVGEHRSEGGDTIVGRKGQELTRVMLSAWRWPVAARWRGDDLGGAVRWPLPVVDGSSSGVAHG
jgi:hypothetical protein